MVEDYRATQLTLRHHPVHFLRETLAARRIVPCARLLDTRDGARVTVAGIVLVRQKPGSAKSVFITLEDESGIANAIVWPDRFAIFRRIIMSGAMLAIRGRVQREGLVIHVIADAIADLTPLLRTVGDRELPRLAIPGDGAPDRPWPLRREGSQGDLIPIKSRDFH